MPKIDNMSLDEVVKKIFEFRDERDWSQFHSPKNLAEAINIEASELLEIFLLMKTELNDRPCAVIIAVIRITNSFTYFRES